MSCSSCYPYSCCCGSAPVRFRSTTAVEWVRTNPILKVGEPGYESDEGGWKIGDGVTPWVDLPYQDSSGPVGPAGPPGAPGQDGAMGPAAPPYSLVIGSVTSGPVPQATITGTPPNQVLNLVLPSTGGGGGGESTLAFVSSPADQSVYDGDTVTFTANAQSTETPIVYGWEVSADGVTWTDLKVAGQTLSFKAVMADSGKHYRCVASTASLGPTYSLVADLTVNENILGTVWRAAGSGAPARIVFAGDKFMGRGGGISDDGNRWAYSAVTFDSPPTYGFGTYVGMEAMRLDVASGYPQAVPYTSPDSISWNPQTRLPTDISGSTATVGTPPNANSAPGIQPVSFANGRFFAFLSLAINHRGTLPNVRVYHSVDGDQWFAGTVSGLGYQDMMGGYTGYADLCEVRGVANSATLSVAVGRGVKGNLTTSPVLTNKCIRSGDRINWVASTLPFSAMWNDVAFGNGLFIAVADGAYAAASTNGVNWIVIRMPATLNWTSIAYGNGVWLATGGPSSIAAVSTDATNWKKVTLPFSATWSGLAYGNGRFLMTNTTGSSIYSGA